MAAITSSMKVGEIAKAWPETMKVFAHYCLDLCCGGAHPLEFVARKHGFSLEKILEELNSVVQGATTVQGR